MCCYMLLFIVEEKTEKENLFVFLLIIFVMGTNSHSFITPRTTINIWECFLPTFFYTFMSRPTNTIIFFRFFFEGHFTHMKENKYLKGFRKF